MTLLQQRMRHQTSVNANDRTSHERLIRRDSTLYTASTIVFLLEKSFYQQTYDLWLTGTERMGGILVFDNKMDKEKVIA